MRVRLGKRGPGVVSITGGRGWGMWEAGIRTRRGWRVTFERFPDTGTWYLDLPGLTVWRWRFASKSGRDNVR